MAILQSLAQYFPEDRLLLAFRTLANGGEAVQQLRELGLEATIDVLELHVTSDESITKVEDWVEKKFGGVDGEPPPRVLFECSTFQYPLRLFGIYVMCTTHVRFPPRLREAVTAPSKTSLPVDLFLDRHITIHASALSWEFC